MQLLEKSKLAILEKALGLAPPEPEGSLDPNLDSRSRCAANKQETAKLAQKGPSGGGRVVRKTS